MRGEAFEDFGARLAIGRWGAKRCEEPALNFRDRQMALRIVHYRKVLLRRAPGETLQGGECDRVSRIGFESGAVLTKGVCDPALPLIYHRETKVCMIVDLIQNQRGLIVRARLLRIACSQIPITEIILGLRIGIRLGQTHKWLERLGQTLL